MIKGATLTPVVLRSLSISGHPVRLVGIVSRPRPDVGFEKETARGKKAHNVSMVFCLASVQWGLLVPFESFEFVSSIDSFRRDVMSRDTAIADLGIGGLIVSVPISRQRYSKH